MPDVVRPWLRVLCTPEGQAIAMEATAENGGLLWVTPDNRPFLLHAMPPHLRNNAGIDRYNKRFTGFFSRDVPASVRGDVVQLWEETFPNQPSSAIEQIVVVDARSVYRGEITNIFLYFADSRPRWAIICKLQCEVAAALYVVTLDEMQKRNARP